jgi:hypothetical protein
VFDCGVFVDDVTATLGQAFTILGEINSGNKDIVKVTGWPNFGCVLSSNTGTGGTIPGQSATSSEPGFAQSWNDFSLWLMNQPQRRPCWP